MVRSHVRPHFNFWKRKFLNHMNYRPLKYIVLVLIVIFIAIGIGYFTLMKKLASTIQRTQTPTQIPTPQSQTPQIPNGNSENQKTYRSEKYGFEVSYSSNLDFEFIATTTRDQIAQFHIHDPNFDFTDKVGQEVRVEYDEVLFFVYPYSQQLFSSQTAKYRKPILEWDNELPVKSVIKSPSGEIKVYQLHSGLVGPYLQGHVHNNKYIFEVYSIFHDELTEDILRTFKFIP